MKIQPRTIPNIFNAYYPTLEDIEEIFDADLEREINPRFCTRMEDRETVIDI